MADNTDLDAGTGGDKIVTREISHGGDTAKLQGMFAMGISGTEGAYTAAAINGDATNGLDVDVTRVSGTVTVDGSGVTQPVSHGALTELAAAINASSQVDVNIAASAATLTVASHAVTNAGTFATQVDGAALTALQLIDNIVAVEDAVAGSGYSGVPMLAVRQDSQTGLAADGDFLSPTIDSAGGLRVSIVAGAGSGGTAAADDADFTAGTTQGTPAMGVYESSPTSVTDGDLGTVGITATRAMKVAIDAGGITGRAEDSAHSSGHEGVVMLAVRRDSAAVGSDTDGDYSTVNVDSTGRLHCNVSNTLTVASHAVTNAGTFAVQNTAQASTNTQEIVGDAADDAATAGNPVLIGGVAVETDGTDPTTVSAEGDAAYLRTDRARRLLVSEHHPRSFFTSADYASAQTNTSVQGAPGAGLSLYITDIVISNGATAGNITLLDGSGGTVKFEIYPAINGGVSVSLRQPIRLTANTALCITSTTVTTHSLNIGGYIAP